jgi:teichuronic acid biosynthesis protein TuaE
VQAKSLATVAHAVLFLFVTAALFGGYLVLPGLGGHSVFSVLAKVLAVPIPLAALYFWWRYRPPGALTVLALTLWLAWVVVSYEIHPFHSYSVLYYTWSQINGWLLVLALWLLARHPGWTRAIVQVSLPVYWLATFAVAAWEIKTGHHLGASAVPGQASPTGLFFDPNNLGAALALLLPFMWFWYEFVPGTAGRLGSVLFTVAGLVVLVETGSRGGELALILDLFALPFVLPPRVRAWAGGALVVGVGALVALVAWARSLGPAAHLPRALSKLARIPDLFTVTLPKHLPPSQAPGSVGIRWALYRSGIQALKDHPFGLGPRGAERWYHYWVVHPGPYNTYGIIDAHNLWLELAIDFGWLGLGLFGLAYLGLLVACYRAARSADPLKRALGRAGFPALVGFVLGSLSPSSVLIGFEVMWVVFGLAVAAARLPEVEKPRRRMFQEA